MKNVTQEGWDRGRKAVAAGNASPMDAPQLMATCPARSVGARLLGGPKLSQNMILDLHLEPPADLSWGSYPNHGRPGLCGPSR